MSQKQKLLLFLWICLFIIITPFYFLLSKSWGWDNRTSVRGWAFIATCMFVLPVLIKTGRFKDFVSVSPDENPIPTLSMSTYIIAVLSIVSALVNYAKLLPNSTHIFIGILSIQIIILLRFILIHKNYVGDEKNLSSYKNRVVALFLISVVSIVGRVFLFVM